MNKTEKLEKTIQEHLEKLGFIHSTQRRYDYYRQDPKAGELGLIFDVGPGYDKRTITVTIFMMFDNPQKAIAAGYDCNPHSGKYNYHGLRDIA